MMINLQLQVKAFNTFADALRFADDICDMYKIYRVIRSECDASLHVVQAWTDTPNQREQFVVLPCGLPHVIALHLE